MATTPLNTGTGLGEPSRSEVSVPYSSSLAVLFSPRSQFKEENKTRTRTLTALKKPPEHLVRKTTSGSSHLAHPFLQVPTLHKLQDQNSVARVELRPCFRRRHGVNGRNSRSGPPLYDFSREDHLFLRWRKAILSSTAHVVHLSFRAEEFKLWEGDPHVLNNMLCPAKSLENKTQA